MLRRLLAASARPPAAAARAFHASTSAPAAEASGLRQAAFQAIQGSPKPLHNKEVFKQLEAALPKDSPLRARLTLTHLKTKILRPLAEASQIKSVPVREEGKKRATFGWVVGKLPPAMKAAARAAAEARA